MTVRRALVGAVVLGAVAWVVPVAGTAAVERPSAQTAAVMNVRQSARLRLVRRSGSTLHHRGTATGTLPGRVVATFQLGATRVTGSVTFHPRSGGSLTFNVVGYPQSTGRISRISGHLAVRRGTGRWSRAVGSGRFAAAVNRRTWATSVNATARLRY